MGQCCPGSADVVVDAPVAPAVQEAPEGHASERVAEMERRNQLLDRFQPQDVRLLRQRFVEAKGDADTLSRERFTTLFELSDMPPVSRLLPLPATNCARMRIAECREECPASMDFPGLQR